MQFKVRELTRDLLKTHLTDFIRIARNNVEDEYWQSQNFLADLNRKWELSLFVKASDSVAGFLIASEKVESIHIHKFVVDLEFQKKGLGTLMLDHLRKNMIKPITLKVPVKNNHAVNFYLSKGFVVKETQDEMHLMMYN